MNLAISKRGSKEKGYSLRDCMRLRRVVNEDNTLRLNSVLLVLMIGAVLHFVMLIGKSPMLMSCYFYLVFVLQIERSVAHSRENLFRVVPISDQEVVRLRWTGMLLGLVRYLIICVIAENAIQYIIEGTSMLSLLFSNEGVGLKQRLCVEIIYGVLYMLFFCMCLMPVTCLKKKKAIAYTILTYIGYGLLTLILMHLYKISDDSLYIIRISFLNHTLDLPPGEDISVRFALWIIFSSIWAIASYAACCRLEKKIGANDATEKMKSAKFQKKIPKGALLGSANLDFRPGTSYLVMVICAAMLVFVVAARYDFWTGFLIFIIVVVFIAIGFIAVYFKNRKNILHRIPASSGALIKMALKYICMMAGVITAGAALVSIIIVGVTTGTEGLAELWLMVTESVPKIMGAGCWLLCLFWLAVPYVFAGEKKAHTRVFTNFALGLLAVTILMILPFWSTGGKALLMLLPAYLLLPLAFFVRGWWSYLEETSFAGLPARLKSLIGIIVGVLVVYVCVCMEKDGGIYDTIIFADDSAPAYDLLTLASAGGIGLWIMAGIGMLCVAATAIFSIWEMKWLLAPDCRRRRT